MTKGPSATIISFNAAFERRYYINLAHASPDWLELKASMAISGFELTDAEAERIGRMIAETSTPGP